MEGLITKGHGTNGALGQVLPPQFLFKGKKYPFLEMNVSLFVGSKFSVLLVLLISLHVKVCFAYRIYLFANADRECALLHNRIGLDCHCGSEIAISDLSRLSYLAQDRG